MSIFQLLLALGVPLGHAAFGGGSATLPDGLRVASAVSALLFLAAASVVLFRSGVGGTSSHSAFVRIGIWVFGLIFGVSALANVASSSQWERHLLAPIAVVLAACFVIVARSERGLQSPP
jgi:hypothetical protein